MEKLKSDISYLEQNVKNAEAEIKLWKQKYLDLEKEKEDLLQEMLQEKELFNSCKEESELMKKIYQAARKRSVHQSKGYSCSKAENNTSPKTETERD